VRSSIRRLHGSAAGLSVTDLYFQAAGGLRAANRQLLHAILE
jgi:hypothetical protein